MNKQFFNRSSAIFFIVITLILAFFSPSIRQYLFNPDLIKQIEKRKASMEKEREWLQEDEKRNEKEIISGISQIVWKWKDFDGQLHKVAFNMPTANLEKITRAREEIDFDGSNITGLYKSLCQLSLPAVSPMIEGMKDEIKKARYPEDKVYIKSLEMVVSAIQFVPYTLVLDNTGTCPCNQPFGSFSSECEVLENGRGCCSGITPFGVYAPAEFMSHKKGDCDTRSLLAFLILKSLGFDVAVMISREQGHSVLGVHLKNMSLPSLGHDESGKKYYLWELTSKDMPLGRGVRGSDWITALK